jgi:hypothetical protein
MRRLMTIFSIVGIFCASAFLYAAPSDRPEKALSAPGATAAVRVTKMRAAGVVIEVTDLTLKIERKVKDKAETMEFALEKPSVNIKAGDKVRVSYITREDKNVATKVVADVPQTAIKKAKNPEVKPAPAGKAPAGK